SVFDERGSALAGGGDGAGGFERCGVLVGCAGGARSAALEQAEALAAGRTGCFGEPEDDGEGGLALFGILAKALADCGLSVGAVEHIVRDLEGDAELAAEGGGAVVGG